MSCEVTIKSYFETAEVRIDTCNKKELDALEKNIISAINQKLDKINILIKNCDVYSNGNCILVHDRFNICPSLKEVAEAFGLKCELVDSDLKGKTYLITDKLLRALKQINVSFNFGSNISNNELNDEIRDIIGNFGFNTIDQGILEIVKNIKKNGVYTISKTREITETYEDFMLVNSQKGNWSIDEDTIQDKRNKLLNIARETAEIIKRTNEYLRDGTAKLIYTRARQMGYAVQEIKKGTQTQLVLVRYE